MFSVVIPLYNKELSVKNTIQSVLDQTFQEFEIVIVNDGSTDDSVTVVESFNDSRIRLIHQKNQGVSAARNRGIEEAKYEWICFLDADDIWKENHLQEFVNLIKLFPDDKVFCTSHTKSKLKEEYEKKIINGYEVIEDYFDVVMKHVDFFWTGAVCVHKTVFDKVGGFPIGINRGEDLYLWAQIGEYYRFVRSLVKTVYYREDSENKLTHGKREYDKSIAFIIDLSKIKGSKRTYCKKIVISRLKSSVRSLAIVEVFKIILQHNMNLILK